MVYDPVVQVLTTQVRFNGGGLDFEDTLLNGKKGDIEGASTEIEDEDVALALDLLVKTVGDGGSGGFVDDTENVETSDCTGILGSQTLGIVEVGRHTANSVLYETGDINVHDLRDDCLLDGLAEFGLRDLLHLGQNHR